MKRGRKLKNKKLLIAAETAAAFALAFLVTLSGAFYSVDNLLRDRIYQNPRGINNKIKIIAIDDKTLSEIGPFGTWSRQSYADLIDILGDAPVVIGFDIMFFGEIDEAGDNALREACKKSGNIVAGSYINYNSAYKTDESGKPYIDHFNIALIEQPITEGACADGFVNASPDDDGIVRSAFLTTEYDGREYGSFSSIIYEKYCAEKGISPNVPSLDGNGRMWISYAGRPYDYEHISYCDVVSGKVDPRVFTDCIVLVGAYASGLQDQFSVPGSADQMYGVEIHANILQGLLDGKYPVPAPRVLSALIAGALCAAVYYVSRRLKFRISTAVTVLAAAGYIAVGAVLNNSGTALPLLYAPAFVLLAFFVNLGRRYASEAIEKRKITAAFRKYVAPQVVEEISKSGNYHICLGGENRNIAVLFVDIRGFTPMSESLEPEQVVDILNSYLNLTTNAIFKNGGTLDKFIGDATMAVFNAPFDLDDYVFRAVLTAWDIVAGGNAIESKFLEKYGKSVSFGVGVNCGNAVVGNIGCDFRMDYTAIGDTVNTAARLEANAKRGQVLISEYVYEQVKDRVTVEPIGEIPLKGKSKGVFVYSLTGITGEIRAEKEHKNE